MRCSRLAHLFLVPPSNTLSCERITVSTSPSLLSYNPMTLIIRITLSCSVTEDKVNKAHPLISPSQITPPICPKLSPASPHLAMLLYLLLTLLHLSSANNILVILLDDVDDLPITRTKGFPNITNYFTENGVIYNNAFVTTPICCPSRASIFTGT